MPFSKRYLDWSPLLLIGLAISYSVIETLWTEPCLQEREGRTAGNLIATAFALYFFAGYGLGITRKYLLMSILTLWAWHLLALSQVLAPGSCAQTANRDRLGELTGFGLGPAMTAVLLLGGATTIAMLLRYRRMDGWPVGLRRTGLAILVALAVLFLGLFTIAAFSLVPQFREVFRAFGADLPSPTLFVLEQYRYVAFAWILSLAALLYVTTRRTYSDRRLGILLNGAIAMLVLVNMVLSGSVFALYAPVLTMCRCV